ncbi:MAG TPA: hypothetical protein DCW29_02170 [Janthinobacterium sp.]|nr:hypothetical protein [Janthinobacterium sp.]
MKKNRSSLLHISTISFALTLAGCGGGGGGDSSTPPTVTVTRTVAGTAAKGILKNATVSAYAVGADGKASTTAIATGTTNKDDGTFSIQIPSDVLTFIVEVTGNANATSADEATGLDVPVGTGFKLRNVVKLDSAGQTTFTGSVSPLTEMITKAAESATGGLSADNITSAKTGFATFFGFNPEQTKPVNSRSAAAASASPEEKLQSVFLAAISQMAVDGALACGTKTTQSDKLSCVIDNIGKIGTLSGGKLNVNNTLSGAMDSAVTKVASNTEINHTGTTSVKPLTKDDGVIPILPPAANPILAATRLFASLRSNINALSNTANTGSLDIRADALRADFDRAVAPLDRNLGKWVQMTTQGIDFLHAYQAGTASSGNIQFFANGSQVGGCTIFSDTTGTIPATAPGNAVSVGCSGMHKAVPGSFTFSAGHSTFKRAALAFTIVPVSAGSTSYTYTARARIETLTDNVRDPNLDVTVGTYGGTPNRARGTIEYVPSGGAISSIAFKGMMPARTDAYGVAITDNESWDLAASRSAESGNLYKYALSGAITSIKNGAAAGTVSLAAGSFLRTEETTAGQINANSVKEFSLALAAEAGGSKVQGTLVMSDVLNDKSGTDFRPTKIAFSGNLSTNSAQFFSGALTFAQTNYPAFDATLPESASNYVQTSATLLGKLSITDRPVLALALNASSLAPGKVSLTGQYDDGSNVVNFSVSDGTPPVTKVSSVDGVSLSLNGGDSVDVFKDDAKVAVLNTKSGMINFTDGSFFSLK